MIKTKALQGSFDQNEPSKVLHIAEAWGGGVVTSAKSMVQASNGASHFFYVRNRSGVQIDTDLNIHLHTGNMLLFVFKAMIHARKLRPQYIFLHSSFAGLLRIFWANKSNVIFVPHCFAVERTDISPTAKWIIRAVESLLASTRSSILAMSAREIEIAEGLGSKKIIRYCNYSSLENHEFTKFGQVKRIGMIGRISAQKNPQLFKSVVDQLSDLNLEWVWIGDGDEKVRKELQRSDVRVTGWLDPADAMKELEKIDLILHTASWEGSPVSTLESLSRGKPVVSSSIPSMVSLGYFTAGIDAVEIAKTIRTVLQDEKLWADVIHKSTTVLSENNALLAKQYMSRIING